MAADPPLMHDTRGRWSWPARTLHWLMALMLAVQVPLGFWMVAAYDAWLAEVGDGALVMRLAQWHNTLGFMLLILVVFRLAWRAGHPVPPAPPGLAAWQRLTARATHGLLYVLLVVFPLSGWAALSAYDGDFPIWFFGRDDVFRIVPRAGQDDLFNADFFGEFHEACWKVGLVVLGLHVVAALWHAWVRKDDVLARMLGR